MNYPSLEQYGAAISRISLGIVILAHSVYLKVFVFTLPGTAQFFGAIGLPPGLAYVVFAIEAVAGVALVLGWRVRLVSAALVPILLGATWAHSTFGWLFTNANGGWEYPLFLSAIAAAQFFLGAGAWVVTAPQAIAEPPPRREVGAR